jgi:hypothetical protein
MRVLTQLVNQGDNSSMEYVRLLRNNNNNNNKNKNNNNTQASQNTRHRNHMTGISPEGAEH